MGISEDAKNTDHLKNGKVERETRYPGGGGAVRGTQGFVGTLSSAWRRPSLTALEVAWRWVYGIPALLLLVTEGRKVLLAASGGTMDFARLGLDRVFMNDPVGALSADPLGAAGKVVAAVSQVLPGVLAKMVWMGPLLALAWVVVSSVGRTVVLKRAEGTLHRRLGTMMALQAIRLAVLGALVTVWYFGLRACAAYAVTGALSRNEEPNLVLYCGMVIVLSLGMFTAWSFVSWVFSVAPMLAMQHNTGVGTSLRGATRLGAVKGKLAEINLVLAIVKVALVVLAMVFSATPLPFEAVTTAEFLAWWWAGVALLYVLWSDFFHVARLVGYLSLLGGGQKGAIQDHDG